MPLSKIDSDSLSAPLTVPAGSAAAPAITTTGDTNTGIFFPAADTIAFAEGGVEAMRIDSSGNVGIGTSSPSHKLDVLANSNASIAIGQSSDDPFIWFDRSDGGSNRLAWRLRESSGRALIFETGTNTTKYGQTFTEAARIDSSGNFMVGTTTVNGDGMTMSPRASGSSTTSTIVFNRASTATAGRPLQFLNGGSSVGYVEYNNTATSYVTSSDYRLKEAIAPMTGALAKVAQLKPCTYKWKVDGSDSQGFIAHELQAVVPECVTGEKDAVDAEGNPQYQGIDTSFLVATLTAAIQELKAIVDAQGAEIAALKGTP